MSTLDWDDLRYALAIGTAGSLAGAARTLGVNHTTVLRRLDALEARLGTRLFDRQRGGYQPTEAGLALVEQARHMATRADEVERQVLGRLTRLHRRAPFARLAVSGGAAANRLLRRRLPEWAAEHEVDLRLVPLAYSGDNAAMIAFAAELRLARGEVDDPLAAEAESRIPLGA